MTRKILKHWALFYKNGERHFINAPTREELDSAVFEGAYAPRFDSVTYYVEYERDILKNASGLVLLPERHTT